MNEKVKIKLVKKSDEEITFDVRGYELPFVNAIRRILLAEVPSMAIEKVELFQNNSEFHDEFLGHRLGLIPFAINADEFEFQEEGDEINEKNEVIFTFNVENPPEAKERISVYSDSLKWSPIGEQAAKFGSLTPVHNDILIVRLAPGQSISANLHLKKGVGKDHAKYSPVSACYYRHLATFDFAPDAEFDEDEIEALKTCFPKDHLSFETDAHGKTVMEIISNRLQTTSELTFMSCSTLEKKIDIKVREKTVAFTVESTGTKPAAALVVNAIDVLRSKCQQLQKAIKKARKSQRKTVAQ